MFAILNGFLWGPGMLALFLLIGLMFNVQTRFYQVRCVKEWLSTTLGSFLRKPPKPNAAQNGKSVSRFQSLCAALAGTLGTGNIVGVASAIALGGPGAIFWMWVSAVVGMMTHYAEVYLGILYRGKNVKGEWVGGAMYYIERGLKCKPLAVVFAVCYLVGSLGMGNMAQVNGIAAGMLSEFGVPALWTGIAVIALSAPVVIGGLKHLSKVTEKLVPLMTLVYIGGSVAVIVAHIGNLPSSLALIFTEAFRLKPLAGGVVGYGLLTAARRGISRGVFTNEAGLGSSVTIHAASDAKTPHEQAQWGIFEVFADTIVVCTVTALAILTSGVYNVADFAPIISGGLTIPQQMNGVALTAAAFSSVFGNGGRFIAVSVTLFAYSTLLCWSFYGERAATYLFGQRAALPYKLVYIAVIFVGCVSSVDLVWNFTDVAIGLMAIPNLAALFLLRKKIVVP
jgi:AGCS family alanine or glycine:cation symporter